MNPIIKAYGHSDIGRSRSKNEDVLALFPENNFFSIADGMGGHKAGEIAAKEATDEVSNFILNNLKPKFQLSQKKIIDNLTFAINKANKKVFSLGEKNNLFKGMGTTFSCIYFHSNMMTYAHVGDSRIYLFRKNNLIQLTKDHSLMDSKAKNIITKAIGTSLILEPEISTQKTEVDDIFFMCTDGLSDFLSKNQIVNIFTNSLSREKSIKNLIEAAKNNGSSDNITSIIIEIKNFK